MTTFNRNNRPSVAELLELDLDDVPIREERGSVKRARELIREIEAIRTLLQWHIADPDRHFMAEGLMAELLGGVGQVLFLAAAENTTARSRMGKMIKGTVDRQIRSR